MKNINKEKFLQKRAEILQEIYNDYVEKIRFLDKKHLEELKVFISKFKKKEIVKILKSIK